MLLAKTPLVQFGTSVGTDISGSGEEFRFRIYHDNEANFDPKNESHKSDSFLYQLPEQPKDIKEVMNTYFLALAKTVKANAKYYTENPIDFLGFAFPSSTKDGRVVAAPDQTISVRTGLDWNGWEPAKTVPALAKAVFAPEGLEDTLADDLAVGVHNDMAAAATQTCLLRGDEMKEKGTYFIVDLGTGLGNGVMKLYDDQIIFNPGELGNLILNKSGTLEDKTAARGIEATAKKMGLKGQSAEEVIKLAFDPENAEAPQRNTARKVMKKVAKLLGKHVFAHHVQSHPGNKTIILGGGGIFYPDNLDPNKDYLKWIIAATQKYSRPMEFEKTTFIVNSETPDKTLGAAGFSPKLFTKLKGDLELNIFES